LDQKKKTDQPRKDLILSNIRDYENRVNIKELSESVLVVNCVAKRNSKLNSEVKHGNFSYPYSIITELKNNAKSVIWYQLESYWQYCNETTPLPEYVIWKNKFRAEIKKLMLGEDFKFKSLVLPHVFGTNDNRERYLNKLFQAILLNRDIDIVNPNELFYLCDKDDLCNYLISEIHNQTLSSNFSSHLFRYHEIELFDLLSSFKQLSNSSSCFNLLENESNLNPFLDPLLLPDLVPLGDQEITSLEVTLQNIIKWLKN